MMVISYTKIFFPFISYACDQKVVSYKILDPARFLMGSFFPLCPVSSPILLYKIVLRRAFGFVNCPEEEFLLDKKLTDSQMGPLADLGAGFKSPEIR